MKTKLLFLTLILSLKVISQVGIGTTTPQAALDIVSESSGILIPRMTATQIEQINQPTEGELVFSTTETGATVNTIGFWYFTGSTWAPIYATSSSGDNIYNSDGNLAGNRIVDLNNFDLNFGPEKLFISGNATGSVGILTATPTEQLDINGNLRVRTLTEGNVITTAEGILTIDNNVFHRFGDLRFSALSLDHNGWYLMDGRPLSTLPAHLQSRAANLGIVGFLPDASGKYIKQGTPGITTGANTVTLNQSNMPDFTINRNTNFVSHTHPIVSPGYTFIRGTNLRQGQTGTASYWHLAGGAETGSTYTNQQYVSSSSGAHSHTISVPTGGSNQPINLNPSNIQLNYFIYLGT